LNRVSPVHHHYHHPSSGVAVDGFSDCVYHGAVRSRTSHGSTGQAHQPSAIAAAKSTRALRQPMGRGKR